jgi:hypothetical protein
LVVAEEIVREEAHDFVPILLPVLDHHLNAFDGEVGVLSMTHRYIGSVYDDQGLLISNQRGGLVGYHVNFVEDVLLYIAALALLPIKDNLAAVENLEVVLKLHASDKVLMLARALLAIAY